jgi:hypothetical protein
MARRREPPAATDLERRIDQLFRGPLDQFVAARNELARELRGAGRREDADRIKDIPKPSITAWAVNRVWWTDRQAFEHVLATGTRLREAQARSLSGAGGPLREAAERRQAAIDAVVEMALRAMGGAAGVAPALRQRVAATVDVLASGDPPEGTTLGRLTRDLQPTGVGALAAMLSGASRRDTVSAPLASRPRPAAPVTRFPAPVSTVAPAVTTREAGTDARQAATQARAAAVADARAALTRTQAALRQADQEVSTRDRAVTAAMNAHAHAQARVEELDARLRQAREEEAGAAAVLGHARRAAEAAHAARTAALDERDRARHTLDDLTAD